MFQYAAGLAVARRLNLPLTLDGSARVEKLPFIRAFSIKEPCYHSGFSLGERVARLLARRLRGLRLRLRKRGLPIFAEASTFDPEFFQLSGSCHLLGYWQSADYFSSVEDEVRRIFATARFSSADGPHQAYLGEILAAVRPVAVHLRRGDYASNPRTRRRFGLCSRAYYDRARRHIEEGARENTARPHYFVFSDDPQAARVELADWTDTTFVEGQSTGEDLHLISRCRQAILANSTFGWWGAWLIAPAADKRVIAPAQWYAPAMQARKPTTRLCPPDWERL